MSGVEARPGGAAVLRGIDLEVPAGGRLAVIGPSGAGKTTLLRVIAGLQPARAGTVEAGGRRIDGLPPHRRPIAMVFQEPRLMPHLDAAENVAFALRARGAGRRERRARADALLADVGLDGFGRRAVRGLSGGECQRVALARALCPEPALLLMDEPLASVDPDRRASLRALILRLQRERAVTTVIVTHDRDEAAEMGERIALMVEGRIVQCDPPAELFLRPRSPAVARFMGLRNVIAGHVEAGEMATAAGRLPVPGADGPARVVLRADGIRPDPAGPLRMEVREAAFVGSALRVRLQAGPMALEMRLPPEPPDPPIPGRQVRLAVAPEAVWRFPEWEPAAAGDHDGALAG